MRLSYTPGGSAVIPFMELHLPTYMKTIVPEFAEIFTSRQLNKEWLTIPSLDQISSDTPTREEALNILKTRTAKTERFQRAVALMVGEILSLKVLKQSSIDRLHEYDEELLRTARDSNDILPSLEFLPLPLLGQSMSLCVIVVPLHR